MPALAEGTKKLKEVFPEKQAQVLVEMVELAKEHLETRRQLGGLAMTVGYTLENEAYKALPALLKRDYGLLVEGRLKRSHVTVKEGTISSLRECRGR